MVKHSKYQKKIFEVYNTTNKNLFIEAGPGTGKTFVLLQLTQQTPKYKKAVMLAFNKSISEELKTKVPDGVDVSTIHSIAFKILRQNVSGNFKLQEIKTFILAKKIIENVFKERKNGNKSYNIYLFTIAKLYDLYRLNLAEKTIENLEALADEYNVELLEKSTLEDTIKVINYIEKYNSKNQREIMIDFIDMLWLTYNKVNKEDFPKYNVVFIDELQDVSSLQREIILGLISKKGRFVGVGDFRQSIYSFMGANLDSFKYFKTMPNTEVLPLSVSYRCPKKVVEFANKIFPNDKIESFEDNPEGVVRKGSFDEIKFGDMVLCRLNKPLIEGWIELVNMNKKSYILGRDFGKNLQNLINSVDSIEELSELLIKKIKDLQDKKVFNPYNHKSYVSLKEKVDIILLLIDKKGYSFNEMTILFDSLFRDKIDNNSIMLSTVHRSKGLESKRVFVIGYDTLMPSPYAKTELEIYQEQCTMYVCVTRAKEELIFINKPKQEDVENLVDMVINSDVDQMKSESNLD